MNTRSAPTRFIAPLTAIAAILALLTLLWFPQTTAALNVDPQAAGTISGQVIDEYGRPIEGVVVDLFDASGLNDRGAWLGGTTTDTDGRYSWIVPTPQCFQGTVTLPEGMTVAGGSRYDQNLACVQSETVSHWLTVGLGAPPPPTTTTQPTTTTEPTTTTTHATTTSTAPTTTTTSNTTTTTNTTTTFPPQP